ncbi:MAG: ribosome biogenesis GTPase YlqF [Firmicutes bacterium]|nr:ribosome biogenesis GTPase YlqF [Bacillota bacterium]
MDETVKIHWFPGHMAKAVRELGAYVKAADVVIYVLDARTPASCINPDFASVIGDRPVLYALTKADLADPAQTAAWLKKLPAAVALDATMSGAAREILPLVDKLAAKKREKWAAKGVLYIPRAVVIGVPNTGKSTLINNLCKKAKTKTGDKPGVTRGRQWVKLESVDLLDTPGALPHKMEDVEAAKKLAFVGCVKDEVIDLTALAGELIKTLNAMDPGILSRRYGKPVSSLADAAEARGYVRAGGNSDTERAATALIGDLRAGRLGRITLDSAL